MAIDLLSLQPQQISKNLKGKMFLIYGDAGCGKTTLASRFKDVLIAGFEMGTNALNGVYVQPVKTWNEWKLMVKQLVSQQALHDKYEAIAIDTADEAWELCSKYICGLNGVSSLREVPWGAAYDQAKKEFAQTFRDLVYSGYGLIFISHSTEKTYKDDKGKEYTKIVPALQGRPFDIVNKMVDLIAYIREIDTGTEEKPQRERFMFFRDEVGDRFLAKSRYKYIAPYVKLDYHELVDAIYSAIDAEVKASGGEASEEVNPYTTRTFDEMMDDARMLWGELVNKNLVEQASDILTRIFEKPTKFSEILPEQADKLAIALNEIRSSLL